MIVVDARVVKEKELRICTYILLRVSHLNHSKVRSFITAAKNALLPVSSVCLSTSIAVKIKNAVL